VGAAAAPERCRPGVNSVTLRASELTHNDAGGDVAGRTKNLRLDDPLCFALYAATNTVIRAYRPLLEQIGLTYPQYPVLLVLPGA